MKNENRTTMASGNGLSCPTQNGNTGLTAAAFYTAWTNPGKNFAGQHSAGNAASRQTAQPLNPHEQWLVMLNLSLECSVVENWPRSHKLNLDLVTPKNHSQLFFFPFNSISPTRVQCLHSFHNEEHWAIQLFSGTSPVSPVPQSHEKHTRQSKSELVWHAILIYYRETVSVSQAKVFQNSFKRIRYELCSWKSTKSRNGIFLQLNIP